MPEMPDRPDLKDKEKQNRALALLRELDKARGCIGDRKKTAECERNMKRIEQEYEQ